MSRKAQRIYTDEDRKAVLSLAARIGTYAAAKETKISFTTLRAWKAKFPDYWSDLIQGQDLERTQANFAGRVDEIAEAYAEVEAEAIDRAAKLLPRADGKETAALMKAISQGRTTAVTTSARLRGEPDERHELTINFGQIEASMERLLGSGEPALHVPNLADADDS